jgi:CHAD domain-containing protein
VSLGQHLKRLRRQARNARKSVLAALRSERYDRLLDALVRTAGSGQPLPEGALRRHRKRDAMTMNNLVRTRWRRLAAAVEALGDDPPDSALHNVTIKAKRCRYTAEAVTPVAGERVARFAVAVGRASSRRLTVLTAERVVNIAAQHRHGWLSNYGARERRRPAADRCGHSTKSSPWVPATRAAEL